MRRRRTRSMNDSTSTAFSLQVRGSSTLRSSLDAPVHIWWILEATTCSAENIGKLSEAERADLDGRIMGAFHPRDKADVEILLRPGLL